MHASLVQETAKFNRAFTMQWLHWLAQYEHDTKNRWSLWTHESYDLLLKRPRSVLFFESVMLLPGVLHGVLDSLLRAPPVESGHKKLGVNGEENEDLDLDQSWSEKEQAVMDTVFGDMVAELIDINNQAGRRATETRSKDDDEDNSSINRSDLALDILLASRMVSGSIRNLLLLQLIRMERSHEQQLSRHGMQATKDNVAEIQRNLLHEYDVIVEYVTYTVALVDILWRERDSICSLESQIRVQQKRFDNDMLNEIAVAPLVAEWEQVNNRRAEYCSHLHAHLGNFIQAYRWFNAKTKKAMDSGGLPFTSIVKQIVSMNARERKTRRAGQVKTFQRGKTAGRGQSTSSKRQDGSRSALRETWEQSTEKVEVQFVCTVLGRRRIMLGGEGTESKLSTSEQQLRDDPIRHISDTYQMLESRPPSTVSEQVQDIEPSGLHTTEMYCFPDEEVLSEPFAVEDESDSTSIDIS